MPRTPQGEQQLERQPASDVVRAADPDNPANVKVPFDIHRAIRRVRGAVGGFADAAMFDLRDAYGYGTLFQQLVACIISIRTRDEVSLPTSLQLLERASTPETVSKLSVGEIDRLIGAATFHESKARQIHEVAQRTVTEFGGELPCDHDVLLTFRGVGPKCANLALGIACGQSRISVDIHVHRVSNRWGYLRTAAPERTVAELEAKLPRRYWIEINRLLVPFGKHVCTGRLPRCSTCPVLDMCRQVGVTAHR